MAKVRGQITITNVNDGTPGRGVVNVTEHYKASTRFTDLSAPDGINYPDWETTPFPNDWNTNNKYLWNYEKIEYSNGDIVRTTPSVITVYGKTIDSIENYYLATNDTSVTKNTEGWTSSIQTMSPENKYLWNYEKISYVELSGNTLYYVEPHIIGSYGSKGTPGLNGDSPIMVYKWHTSNSTPPSISGNKYPPTNWYTGAPTKPSGNESYYLWMALSMRHGSGTIDNWSTPTCISGEDGNPGEDASDIEWIYRLDSSADYNTGSETDKQLDGWVPNNWSNHALSVTNTNKTLYASWRKKERGLTTWGEFQSPIIWSHYGRNGTDGDGIEYVYIRTTDNNAPTIIDSDSTYNNKTYINDDYLPLSSAGRCTDDPTGPDSTYKYEWVAKRSKSAANSEGVRTWEKYSGTMSLWSNHADSILKSGESVYYVLSTDGITPKSGYSWGSNKPLPALNEYVLIKTIISWSDGSTTELISAERNPNDGKAGMDITIGSLNVKYAKSKSATRPDNNQFGDYPSSLNKGDYLHTKTTVNYVDSEGHAVNSTVTYSVSYIGTDGSEGRGIVSIIEEYSVSDYETSTPSTFSSTFPSTWNGDHPYLWNREVITYSKGTPATSVTEPRIKAIYTTDGKGIDSIINYYVATNLSSGVTTSNPSDGTWTTAVQACTSAKRYLWNYEAITYTDGISELTTPHIIGVYGEKGESGEDALNVICTPSALIINLNINNKTNLDSLSSDNSAKCTIQVYKGNTKLDITNLSKSSSPNCSSTASVSDGNGYIQINSISKDGTNYYDKGSITLIVTANDNGTSRQIKNIKIPFYCNLLGTWKETVENDTKTIAAQKVVTEMNERGVLTTTSNEYTSLVSSTQALESWKSTAQSTINGHTTSIINQNTRLTTAESNINTVRKEVESEQLLDFGGWYVSAGDGIEYDNTDYNILCRTDGGDSYVLITKDITLKAGTYVFQMEISDTDYLYEGMDMYVLDYEESYGINFIDGIHYMQGQFADWKMYGVFTLNEDKKVTLCIEQDEPDQDLSVWGVMLSEGNTPKTFNPNGKIATESSVSQTADGINLSIRNGLEETGINIGTKKIVAKTNNFEIRNSSNQKTFGIDADGNLEARGSATFKGAVKASRYYDNVEFLYRSANPQTITLTNLVGTYFIRNGTSNSFEIILPDPDNHDGLELTFYGSSVDSPRGDIIINCNASWAYPNNGSGLYAFRTVGDLYINNSIIGMDVLDILFPCLNDLSQMNAINLSLIHSGPATLKLKSARDTGHISNHNLWIIIEGSNIVLAKGTYNVAI